MDVNASVIKGGVCWFDLTLDRGKKGLEFFLRADPRIEDFMKSLGGASPLEAVEMYGREWYPTSGKPLLIYAMERDLPPSPTYTLSKPAEPFRNPTSSSREISLNASASNRLNLSFLRLAGISNPDGFSFGVYGPFSEPYISQLSKEIVVEVRNIIRDYIVPVHINLRISSQQI